MKLPNPENEFDNNILKHIKNKRWGVIYIPEDDEGAAYGFSVGLYHNFNHPEFIIFGLSQEITQTIINNLGSEINQGRKFSNLQKSENVLQALTCQFAIVKVEHYEEYLGYANWLYEALPNPYPCLQILWPDKKGILPTEKGCDEKLLSYQPMLYKK